MKAAIVDFEMGNLFSVKRACEIAGMQGIITTDPKEILSADAVLLPGVGAFGDAMKFLKGRGLVDVLKEVATIKYLFGVCLGMQLLMTKSYEFGEHEGLNLIPGRVVRFLNPRENDRTLKVPHVGWNQVRLCGHSSMATPFQNVADGTYMYFVHSYYVQPDNENVVLTKSTYGNIEFCSSLARNKLFACQFHPERSAEPGLNIYRAFASLVRNSLRSETL